MIKLYVIIKKAGLGHGKEIGSQKMLITLPRDCSLPNLKRSIEREFQNTYPNNQPFTCQKIEDEFGYAITNSAPLMGFVESGARVIAIGVNCDEEINQINYYGDIEELAGRFSRSMTVFAQKLGSIQFAGIEFESFERTIKRVMHIGFTNDVDIVKNYLKFLKNAIIYFDRYLPAMSSIFTTSYFIGMVEFWVHAFILNANININLIEIIINLSLAFPILAAKLSGRNVRPFLSQIIVSNYDLSPAFKKELLKLIRILGKGKSESPDQRDLKTNLMCNKENDILDDFNINQTKNDKTDRRNEIPGLSENGNKREVRFRTPHSSQIGFGQKSLTRNGERANPYSMINEKDITTKHKTLGASSSQIGFRFQNGKEAHSQNAYEVRHNNHYSTNHTRSNHELPQYENNSFNHNINKSHARMNLEKSGQEIFPEFDNKQRNDFEINKNKEADAKVIIPSISKVGFGTKGNEEFMIEYFDLVSETSDKDMNQFIIENLAKNINFVIYDIMSNRENFIGLMKIFPLPVRSNQVEYFVQIYSSVIQTMNSMTASVAMKSGLIKVILDQIKTQYDELRPSFLQLISCIFEKSTIMIDMQTVFAMINEDMLDVKILGAKFVRLLTDPTVNKNYDESLPQFETHLKSLMECLKRPKEHTEFLVHLLSAFSNLCVSDYLRPQIIYLEGIHLLLRFLRSADLAVELQRISMRGLFNIATKSKELKVKVLSELGYEIEKMTIGDLDSVVKGYVITLIRSN
jgi:hypothetical protein